MKLAYVAGPCRTTVAETLWAMGYAVVCAADIEALRKCDFVALAPGWERSEGARAEVREALAREIGVMQVDGGRCRWLTAAEVRAAMGGDDSGAERDALCYVRDKARTTLNAAGVLPMYARHALIEIEGAASAAIKEG